METINYQSRRIKQNPYLILPTTQNPELYFLTNRQMLINLQEGNNTTILGELENRLHEYSAPNEIVPIDFCDNI